MINFLVLFGLAFAILVFSKGLQQDFLEQDYVEERDFILSEYNIEKVIQHRTKNILIEFIPSNLVEARPEYRLFRGLREGRAMNRQFESNTYQVNVEKIDIGTFYHARNISEVLTQERFFLAVVMTIFIIALLLSLILSYTSSKRIIQPLKYLSERIANSKVGEKNTPIETDFKDVELQNIAGVFNEFLHELELFVIRERSLIGLASHELKTPVAVISGAVEVLKSKFELPERALGPILRIENASEEMSSTIPVLLELSRRAGKPDICDNLNIDEIVLNTIDDLSQLFDVDARISYVCETECFLSADKTLAKMLIRNLIQNALQHTSGNIGLSLSSRSLSIKDEGSKNQNAYFKEILNNTSSKKGNSSSGLGLYIVTLVSERLGWPLNVITDPLKGSAVTIRFSL